MTKHLKLWLFLVPILALSVYLAPLPKTQAQGGLVTITNAADITGAAAAVQVNTSGTARWIQIIAPSTNSAVLRCGDSTVSATKGLPIAAGGGIMFPPMPVDQTQAVNQHYYSLSTVYCYVANADKASFAWGN